MCRWEGTDDRGTMSEESTPPPGRRRGRPQRLPDDPHPISSGVVGCDQRIAWLLTVARVLGPDPDLARRDGFIAALKRAGRPRGRLPGLALGVGAAAAARPGRRDVRAGPRPAGGLAGLGGRRAAPLLRQRPDAARRTALRDEPSCSDTELDRLLDRTEAGGATGAHWLRLADHFNRFDRVFLREREWTALCHALVSELGVGRGHRLRPALRGRGRLHPAPERAPPPDHGGRALRHRPRRPGGRAGAQPAQRGARPGRGRRSPCGCWPRTARTSTCAAPRRRSPRPSSPAATSTRPRSRSSSRTSSAPCVAASPSTAGSTPSTSRSGCPRSPGSGSRAPCAPVERTSTSTQARAGDEMVPSARAASVVADARAGRPGRHADATTRRSRT